MSLKETVSHETFIRVWQHAATIDDVAHALGMTPAAANGRAKLLRDMGVPLLSLEGRGRPKLGKPCPLCGQRFKFGGKKKKYKNLPPRPTFFTTIDPATGTGCGHRHSTREIAARCRVDHWERRVVEYELHEEWNVMQGIGIDWGKT